MAQKLSNRRIQILNFIEKHIREKGYPPTVREIGEAVGLKSSSTVHGHLRYLEEKGFIHRQASLTRAITLPQHRRISVPLIGRVAAGQPILAEENYEEVFELPTDLLPTDQAFMLRVRGDSMIGDGIFDGDLVVVRPQPTVENGEIGVVLIEDEATVKRVYFEGDRVRLQPSNPHMEPIYTQNAQILGKVVVVFRRLS